MSLSGFVLDLLVPGLVSIAVGFVLAIEFGVDPTVGLSSTVTTLLLSGGIVAAYLVGIAFRHSFNHLQARNPDIVRERLLSSWPDQIENLKQRWLEPCSTQSSGILALSTSEAGEIIQRIEEYYLSVSGEAWGEHLQYHRGIARVASNSLYPLVLLSSVAATAAARRGFNADFDAMLLYLAGVVAGLLVAAGLSTAHRKRMEWTTDKLVRTELAHQFRSTD